jgi:Family of unknown function (DUF5678)
MNASTSTPLTFTAAERRFLSGLLHRGLRAVSCAEDGDEWAALLPAKPSTDIDAWCPVLSVQLSSEFGGRYVALSNDRKALARGDDLTEVLAAAQQTLAESEATAWVETAIAVARGKRKA